MATDLRHAIAKNLAQEIFSGVYPENSKIPHEIDLAKSLGVSRSSVREAIQLLSSKGVLNRISGKGTFVQGVRQWNLLDESVATWVAGSGLIDEKLAFSMFESRYMLEPFVAGFAATRGTAQDLVEMETAINLMHASRDDRSQFTEGDIALHTAVFKATHNPIWIQHIALVKPSIKAMIHKSNTVTQNLDNSLHVHNRIFEAIRKQQPVEAFDAACDALLSASKEHFPDLELGVEKLISPPESFFTLGS